MIPYSMIHGSWFMIHNSRLQQHKGTHANPTEIHSISSCPIAGTRWRKTPLTKTCAAQFNISRSEATSTSTRPKSQKHLKLKSDSIATNRIASHRIASNHIAFGSSDYDLKNPSELVAHFRCPIATDRARRAFSETSMSILKSIAAQFGKRYYY